MSICLRHVEAVIRDRSFFTDFDLYIVKKGDRRKNLPSSRLPYSW